MKKMVLSFLAITSIFAMTLSSTTVNAVDFSKNESKYIKLCSSSSLSSNKKTCEEFNKYLSKKNKELKADIQETKSDLEDTKDDIAAVESKIKKLNTEISQKEKEINYLLSSISKVEKDIKKKESLMQERLYVMQSQYNSNNVANLLFESDSIEDFFSRLSSIQDITSYEKDLISDLNEQKAELDQQKVTLKNARESLKSQKGSQESLKANLNKLKEQQQKEIKENQAEAKKVSEAQKKIDAALDALISNAPSGGGGSYVPGNSETGNAIAQKALSQLGKRYWWGAEGPNYYDCSGLVYWAHNQAGVKIGRTTAAGYSQSGKSVTRSQLQPGDVITFSYGSGVAHIGIYIGGGSFVHASGKGSGTVGQYPDQCVKTSSLSGYWERYVYNYRRLY